MQTDLLTTLLFRQAAAAPTLPKTPDADFELVFLMDSAAEESAGIAPLADQSQQRQTTDGSPSDTESAPEIAVEREVVEGDELLDFADDSADFRRVVLTGPAPDTSDSRTLPMQPVLPRTTSDTFTSVSIPLAARHADKPIAQPTSQPIATPATALDTPAYPMQAPRQMRPAHMMPQATPDPIPAQRVAPDPRTTAPAAPQIHAGETPRPVAVTSSPLPQPETVSQISTPQRSGRPNDETVPTENQSVAAKVAAKTVTGTPVIPVRVPQQAGPAESLTTPHQPQQVVPKTQPAITQKPTPAQPDNIAVHHAPKPAHNDALPQIQDKRPASNLSPAKTLAKMATPTAAPDTAREIRPVAAPLTPNPQTVEAQVDATAKPATPETPPPATRTESVRQRQTVSPSPTAVTSERSETKPATVVAKVIDAPAARAEFVPILRSDARVQAPQQAPVANQAKPVPMAPAVEPRPVRSEVTQPTNPQAPQARPRAAGPAKPIIADPAAAAQPTTVAPSVPVQSPPAIAQPIDTPRKVVAPKPAPQWVSAPPSNPPAVTVQPDRGTPPQPVTAQPVPSPAPAATNTPLVRADVPKPRPEPILPPARPRDMAVLHPDTRRDRVKLGEPRTTTTRTAEAMPTADPKPALRPADAVTPAPQSSPQPTLTDPAPRDAQTAAVPQRAPDDSTLDRIAPRPATPIPDPVAEPQMPKLAAPTTPMSSADPVPSSEPAELRLDPLRDTTLTPTQAPAKSVMSPQADLSARVMDQIAQHVRQLPGGPLEITLSPEELGRVRMQLTTAENGLTLVVTAERPETLDLLRRNIDQLANEYRSLGYGALSFAFQGDGTPRDGHPGRHQPGGTPLTMADDITPVTAPPPLTAATGMDIRI